MVLFKFCCSISSVSVTKRTALNTFMWLHSTAVKTCEYLQNLTEQQTTPKYQINAEANHTGKGGTSQRGQQSNTRGGKSPQKTHNPKYLLNGLHALKSMQFKTHLLRKSQKFWWAREHVFSLSGNSADCYLGTLDSNLRRTRSGLYRDVKWTIFWLGKRGKDQSCCEWDKVTTPWPRWEKNTG